MTLELSNFGSMCDDIGLLDRSGEVQGIEEIELGVECGRVEYDRRNREGAISHPGTLDFNYVKEQ